MRFSDICRSGCPPLEVAVLLLLLPLPPCRHTHTHMLPVSQWRKMHYITQDVRAVLNMQAHQYSHWEDRVGQKECVYVCAMGAVVCTDTPGECGKF